MRSFRFPILLAAGLTILLLSPVLDGRFFCDDFRFVLDHPAKSITGSFGELHPYRLYRPLQLSVVALSQTLFGAATWPVRVVSIAFHLGLVMLGLHLLRRMKAPSGIGLIFAAVMGSSQLIAPAVGGNDTLSLVMGTFWGLTACWCFWPAAHRPGRRHTATGLMSLALSLFSKESSLGYAPVLVGLALVERASEGDDGRTAHGRVRPELTPDAWVRIGGVFLVTAAWLLWRNYLGAVGPRFDGTGGWRIGLNVPTNLAMLWAAALLPVSTTEIFGGVARQQWHWPLAGAVLLQGTLAAWAAGLGRHDWRAALTGVAAASITVAPVLFMGRVSELYAYALLPAVAMLGALACGRLLGHPARSVRFATVGLVIATLIGQGSATIDKARCMAGNGQVAAAQMAELLDQARSMPRGGCLVMLDPTPPRPQYSVYWMDGFRLTPPEEVKRLSGRTDLRVIHVDDEGPGTAARPPRGARWVSIVDRHVRAMDGDVIAELAGRVRIRSVAD